jgi:uncharacterized protein YaaN involved in tellurite resistance
MENQEILQPRIISTNQPIAKSNKSVSIIHLNDSGKIDLSKYTQEEIVKYQGMSTALKTNDVNSILNFGAELQNNLAKYSDTFLNSVKAFDAGEIGISITDLLTEINYIDIDPSENGTFKRILLSIPGLKNLVMNTKKIFQKYDTISGNIDGIIKKLEKGKLTILKDNVNLQNLFEQNLMYINKLEELIIGGQIKYNELESELSAMESNIAEYQDYEISDKREFLTRLSKRLTDMQITRTITIQSLPQIRLVQNNNVTMVEKIQSSVTTTIPIWKNQISIAVALMRQKGILDVQKKISDTTNLILNKNAEMLKQNSIDVAKENEKTIVSMETLHNVNQKLIETLTEVKRIKEEGEASRRDVAKQLESLEKELKANVLQLK